MVLFKILIALFACYAVCVISFMSYYANRKASSHNSVLVILGCQVKGNKPSRSLKRRLDVAYNFLDKNKDIYCIVSGGKGNDELISEAECMYSYLIDKGIAKERIFKEDTSTSTEENLISSLQIIKEHSLPHNIIIATDFYHQLRANIIGKKYSIKISGAISCMPSVKILIINILRELIAIPYEIIKPVDKK